VGAADLGKRAEVNGADGHITSRCQRIIVPWFSGEQLNLQREKQQESRVLIALGKPQHDNSLHSLHFPRHGRAATPFARSLIIMKLSRKLPMCFAAVALAVASAGLFGLAQLNSAIATYRGAVTSYSEAQEVETILSTFKTQVQEWKNTLLRGKNDKDRAKYWQAFAESERDVAAQTAALTAKIAPGAARTLLAQFAQAHTQMGSDYRKGYAAFTEAAFDATAGDAAVKGKDRSPTELLNQARKQIVSTTEANVAQAAASSERATLLSLIAMLIGASGAVAAGVIVSRSIVQPLKHAVDVAESVAAGDLTTDITAVSNDETGQLLTALSAMNTSLKAIVTNVRAGAETIAIASDEIAQGNLDLSARTEQQAGALEETASSMEELTSTVRMNADNANQANRMAISARDYAVQGEDVVKQAVDTMALISESSKQIADIIGVIDGIAFQTNILALNAAVEAARAGEQGRGFAVVASEVRNLAQRSASAAKEIKALISGSVSRVEAGSLLVSETGATMAQIIGSVKRVTDIMTEIHAATAEQSAGIEQVNMAVIEMDTTTQRNAALVEEAAAAAQALREQTLALTNVVSVFKLDRTAASGQPAPGARAASIGSRHLLGA
jgi:methyl-accepting chemotaxis protein-1 (serine sensor receptor)